MGLLQNGYRDIISTYRIYGAGVSNGALPQECIGNRHLTGMLRNITVGEGITSSMVGIPMGHNIPSSWMIPQKAGRITCFTACKGSTNVVGSAAAGIGISGQSDGVCTLSASGISIYWASGTTNGISTGLAYIIGISPLSGEALGYSTLNGLLFASVNIQGQSDGLSNAYAGGSLAISITGLINGLSLVEGAMSGTLNMDGILIGSSDIDGNLVGAYFCTGLSQGNCNVLGGDLEGYGWVEGQANGISTSFAQPFAHGFMSGSTSVQASVLSDADVAAIARGIMETNFDA